MMRAPPSPTTHQNFNFFSPHSSQPEYSYDSYNFMVQNNNSSPKFAQDKRRTTAQQQQQPQIAYSQPQTYSSQPDYTFNMQTGFSAAPQSIGLQQTATPDSSRRSTPMHSPARQFVGSSAGDWSAMYVPTSAPGTQFGGYSQADVSAAQFVPKMETSSFLAAPGFQQQGSQSMGRVRSEGSHSADLPPLSVSSRPSVSEGGLFSPLTPSSNPEIDDLGHAAIHMSETVPKSEALDSYSFATVAPPQQSGPRHLPSRRLSPAAANIPNLYHQAQTQHSIDRTSRVSDQRSPFRASSPFHPGRNVPASPVRHNHYAIRAESNRVQSTPKTISPKEAFLEYHPQPEDESSKINLFAPTPSDNISVGEDMMSQASNDNTQNNSFDFMNGGHGMDFPSNFDFDAPAMPGIPQDYHYQSTPHIMETSKPHIQKDHGHSGAYACSVPGCTQRFQTPTKLSKHRREVHRQTSPTSLGGGLGMTSTAHIPKSHIPGPHKCTRINPTTGKPCNTIFSRPYDLTRHEDTIHNTTREKARCEICNDEKTFSRQDALTRHKKVKHGIDK